MKKPLTCLLFALILQFSPRNASASDPIYSQTYSIFLRGVYSGTEKVTEELDKQGNLVSSSESEIFLSDGIETKRLAFVTRAVLAKGSLTPISYSYRYTSGESKDGYEVRVKDGQLHRVLERGGHISEATAPLQPEITILDFNVYHQYDYVIRKYDLKRGGRQSFRNFIPLIGSEVPLSLTRMQDTKLEYDKGVVNVQNYKIEFAGIWTGTCSTDTKGRLVRLVVREQDLEVLKSELVPETALETPPGPDPEKEARPPIPPGP